MHYFHVFIAIAWKALSLLFDGALLAYSDADDGRLTIILMEAAVISILSKIFDIEELRYGGLSTVMLGDYHYVINAYSEHSQCNGDITFCGEADLMEKDEIFEGLARPIWQNLGAYYIYMKYVIA